MNRINTAISPKPQSFHNPDLTFIKINDRLTPIIIHCHRLKVNPKSVRRTIKIHLPRKSFDI
jgi:hypothetical protein